MSLPSSPPQYATWADMYVPIREGANGWPVFAVQRSLTGVTPDGAFGPKTAGAVKAYQKKDGMTVDGIVGPATQAQILTDFSRIVDQRVPAIPDGLMRGFCIKEGAGILAATNWSVKGGVDCGPMQLRCAGPLFRRADLQRAFTPLDSMLKAANDYVDRLDIFKQGKWVKAAKTTAARTERAMRCAIFAHNWPTEGGADYYSQNGHVSSPDAKCTWVQKGTKFPDGVAVVTRQQWAEFYAMGGPHGEGSISSYVTNWS